MYAPARPAWHGGPVEVRIGPRLAPNGWTTPGTMGHGSGADSPPLLREQQVLVDAERHRRVTPETWPCRDLTTFGPTDERAVEVHASSELGLGDFEGLSDLAEACRRCRHHRDAQLATGLR